MEKRFHIARLPGLSDHLVHIAAHAGEGGKIGLHIVLRLRHGHPQVLAEGEGGDTVNNAEVHGLGPAAHLVGHILPGHMEDLRRRLGVEISPGQEGRLHGLIPGDVGQNT